MIELLVDAFGVRLSVRAVPRSDHVSHLEGFTLSMWQAMPCERVVKASEEDRNLFC